MIPLMPLIAAVLSLLTSVNGLGLAPANGRTELTIRVDGAVSSVKDYRLGDPDRLKQVLLNLLDNAIRFTDAEAGVIRVRVSQAGEQVQLAVSDNGSGIPAEAQQHIFERFFRVDKARARASGGSGLGLAIVKAIVEAHGGSIAPVHSEAGRGSVFELTFPRAAPPAAGKAA